MPKYKKNQVSLRDTYAHYKKNISNPLSYKEHRDVLDTYGNVMADYIVGGADVKLYRGLSVLGIRKLKQEYSIDGPATMAAGKLVKKPNTHSDFFTAFVYWARHYTTINMRGWYWLSARKVKNRIKDVMEQHKGHTRYPEKSAIALRKGGELKQKMKKIL